MRCASSNRGRPSRRRRLGLLALAGAAFLAIGTGGAANGLGERAPHAQAASYRIPEASLGPREQRTLRASVWQGGALTASTGESVRVYVSDAYPDAGAAAQRWADHFASLLHGSELGLVTAYVVTPSEMEDLCGPHALGCYGGNELAFIGETMYGVTPEEVASHEYGHHVAANRLNPPWLAVDWGPKRWSSAANVCRRTQLGTAYPGDEDEHYELNPGEGFAEVYRVLNEVKGGASNFGWTLVDGSFYPDSTALQAAEEDIVAPWAAPITQSFRGRFVRNGTKIWRVSVPTLLDGGFTVTLTFPKGALYDLTVLGSDGRTSLARGLWSGVAEKRVTATVCGQRSLTLRVTQRGSFSRFVLRVTHD